MAPSASAINLQAKLTSPSLRPMAFPFAFPSLGGLLARRALLAYAATWTAVAVTAVAVAAFAPELAFVWAVGPGTPLSGAWAGATGGDGFSVGLPLDGPPWDAVCVPAGMFGRAGPDVVVPLVFAVVVVTGAVWFTTAVGVWEHDGDRDDDGPPASVEHV